MVKIGVVRWKGRCSKHPAYNPGLDGLGGIRGGCRRCEMLLEIYNHHVALVRLLREFGARTDSARIRSIPEADSRQMSLLD